MIKNLFIALFILLWPVNSYADWATRLGDAYDVDQTLQTEDQAYVWDDVVKLWVAEDIVTLIGGDARYLMLDWSNLASTLDASTYGFTTTGKYYIGSEYWEWDSTLTDFVFTDDIIIKDIHPGWYIWNIENDIAFGWHYHMGATHPIAFWRLDDGDVSPNVPLQYFKETTYDAYFYGDVYADGVKLGAAGAAGAPADATYITQTADDDLDNEQALSDLAAGILYSNGSGVISKATADQIEADLLDDAIDFGTGVVTAAGFTVANDENITFGSETIDFETATNDFNFTDDINISDIDPHIQLIPTVGDAFEIYAYGGEIYCVNVSTGEIIWRYRGTDDVNFDDNNLSTTGTITATTFSGDVGTYGTVLTTTETLNDFISETIPSGVTETITISDDGGLDFSWSTGEVHVNGHIFNTTAGSDTAANNDRTYLYATIAGSTTLQTSTTYPTGDYAMVATIDTYNSDIIHYYQRETIGETIEDVETHIELVHAKVVANGLLVAEDTTGGLANDFTITSGTWYHEGLDTHTLEDTWYSAGIGHGETLLHRHYHAGAGNAWATALANGVDFDKWDKSDGDAGVNDTSAGKWYCGWIVAVDIDHFDYVYPQTEHANEQAALQEVITYPPYHGDVAVPLAKFIFRHFTGAGAFGDRAYFADIRPVHIKGVAGETVYAVQDLWKTIDSDAGSTDANLTYDTLTIAGTANETETSVSGDTLTIGLPDDVIITGTLSSGDIDITGAGPDLSLIPTSGDTFGFHVEPAMSQAWLSNETDGVHYLFFDADHTMRYGRTGNVPAHIFTGDVYTNGTLFTGVGLDAIGAVDMDYGSADVTDHTFTSDGGTAIIDGSVTATDGDVLQANSAGDDKNVQIYHDDTDGQIASSSGDLILEGGADGNEIIIDGIPIKSISAVNMDGIDNTFIGVGAGDANTTGDHNIFIGAYSGGDNTTGSTNVFLKGGIGNTEGTANFFLGDGAGNANTDENYNVYIGGGAGENATASNNTCIGSYAGNYLTGGYNLFLGRNAGEGHSGGANSSTNVGIGGYSGYSITTANNNVWIGQDAGNKNTSGDENVMIGKDAGKDNQTGSGNVFIGYKAGEDEVNPSNKLFIDNSNTATPLIYGDFSTDELTIWGEVGIGTTNPQVELDVVGDGTFTGTVEGATLTEGGNAVYSTGEIIKKRVYISCTAGLVPTTTGCADAAQTELGSTDLNRINVMTCDFDASSDEYWIAHFTLPENYDGGTFTAAVSWTCTADAAKGVAWFIQLLGTSSGDVMGATDFGTAVEMNDDGETTNDYLLTAESSAITENHAGGSGTTVGGDELWVKLYRDVSDGDDDLDTDAKMMGIWLTFGIDALSTED